MPPGRKMWITLLALAGIFVVLLLGPGLFEPQEVGQGQAHAGGPDGQKSATTCTKLKHL